MNKKSFSRTPRLAALGVALCFVLCPSPGLKGEQAETSGSPGPVSLSLNDAHAPVVLVGPDARLQLLATAEFQTGPVADWTGSVQYRVEPAGIVDVSDRGLVRPLANGTVQVTATGGGISASVQITVEQFDNPPRVSFINEVVPIFSKLSCNSGGCHGKSGGQNGFALSLLGYEPWRDYDFLVVESRGRRIVPGAPQSSLLLLKATNILPHGGGQRMTPDSREYLVLSRWISQGMAYGSAQESKVVSITTLPDARILPLDGVQQLRVLAHYQDGRVQDVTQLAQFEPNEKTLAETDPSGRVVMKGQPGDVAVMVKYQEHVSTFRATVPLGVEVGELPPPRNYIDEKVFAKLRELGMPPSPGADDTTFLRRVTLDVTGRLPQADRATRFLSDGSPDKRERYIDELLESEAYADYFANKWASILRNKRTKRLYQEGTYAFHQWVRACIHENKPYDLFVRELLTAAGPVGQNPPTAWFRQVHETPERVEDTAQLFTGIRIQCARCHHHPFEVWSQDDYYGLAAFFSTVSVKMTSEDDYSIYMPRQVAQAENPTTGKVLPPAGLAAKPTDLTPEQDPRVALADWLASPDNPFFARSLVNRYWKHFLNRGIVEPEDDMRLTNPPSNPQLLDALAADFIRSGYDLKHLVRTICNSRTYQLSAIPNEHNTRDTQAYSRYYPRRLDAEALLDAVDGVNGTTTAFKGLPAGTLAVQLPDHAPAAEVYFMSVFGRPGGDSACSCERVSSASLAQSLHLINSSDIQAKLTGGKAKTLAEEAQKPDADKVRELYLVALSRSPTTQEQEVALNHIAKTEKKQEAYEDVIWALINTKEFLFNH